MQVLGEAMAGISHNAKNSNLPEFGDSVSSASKALCGLTEAAAQVKSGSVCIGGVGVSCISCVVGTKCSNTVPCGGIFWSP